MSSDDREDDKQAKADITDFLDEISPAKMSSDDREDDKQAKAEITDTLDLDEISPAAISSDDYDNDKQAKAETSEFIGTMQNKSCPNEDSNQEDRMSCSLGDEEAQMKIRSPRSKVNETVCRNESDVNEVSGKKAIEKQQEQQIPTSSKDFEITETCPVHSHKLIECFCSSHDALCCTICVLSEHTKCGDTLIYIPNAIPDFDEKLEFEKLTNKLSNLTEKVSYNQKRIELNTVAIEAYRNDTKAHINKLQQEMNELFEAMKTDVDKNADGIQRKDTDNMKALNMDCSSVSDSLQTSVNKLNDVRQMGKTCQLYITIKQQTTVEKRLEEQIKEIEQKNKINRYEFQPNAKCVDLLQLKHEELGQIVEKDINTYKVNGVANIELRERDKSEQTDRCISGMVVVSENCLVASDSENKQILTVNLKKNSVASFLPLAASPGDLTRIAENELLVALPDVKTLHCFTLLDEGMLKIGRKISVDQECHGVAFYDNMLIVSFIPKTYMRPSTVQVLDMSGQTLKSLYQTWTGSPGYLTVNRATNTLYMTDRGNSTVTCISLEGSTKAVYLDKDLQQPNGITYGQEGFVYVCGRKTNNIVQLSENCTKIQILQGLGSEIHEPVSLAFCETNQRLYVGMKNSGVIKSISLI